MKKIRIGMVCPYGWDTPGGVQTHIRDLTEHLIEEGHHVSVLAPVTDDSIQHEDYWKRVRGLCDRGGMGRRTGR